jgi:hypothetical protein
VSPDVEIVAGPVPDGVKTVEVEGTRGTASTPVHDNVFVVRAKGRSSRLTWRMSDGSVKQQLP